AARLVPLALNSPRLCWESHSVHPETYARADYRASFAPNNSTQLPSLVQATRGPPERLGSRIYTPLLTLLVGHDSPPPGVALFLPAARDLN
ncbi:hypothetical protein TARUN_10172, partial [Trichoderma arundinaceum]